MFKSNLEALEYIIDYQKKFNISPNDAHICFLIYLRPKKEFINFLYKLSSRNAVKLGIEIFDVKLRKNEKRN